MSSAASSQVNILSVHIIFTNRRQRITYFAFDIDYNFSHLVVCTRLITLKFREKRKLKMNLLDELNDLQNKLSLTFYEKQCLTDPSIVAISQEIDVIITELQTDLNEPIVSSRQTGA